MLTIFIILEVKDAVKIILKSLENIQRVRTGC